MEPKVETYNRRAVCCSLNEFDPIFATESDFIEVCDWKNGEGYDITINDKNYYYFLLFFMNYHKQVSTHRHYPPKDKG